MIRNSSSDPTPSDYKLVARIRHAAGLLVNLSATELRARGERLREAAVDRRGFVFGSSKIRATRKMPIDGDRLVEAFAVVNEAARRALEIEFYDVQFLAGLALVRQSVAEMQTGEGKTFVAALPAFVHALAGRGVHVMTSNHYLATRDFAQLAPVFETLGMSAGLLPEQAAECDKRAAYSCDVTYGTGYEFGFDYLRDQLALRQTRTRPLGALLLSQLRGTQGDIRQPMQRFQHFAIVDEIDNVLIDDANSPLVLSDQAGHTAPGEAAVLAAREVVARLEREQDYVLDHNSTVRLTKSGAIRIHASTPQSVVDPSWPRTSNTTPREKSLPPRKNAPPRGDFEPPPRALPAIPLDALQRPWQQYVEQALRAEFQFRRDIHYVVEEGEVRIVDQSTGRIFTERTWQDGLHQAVEAKEGVRINAEKQPIARITKQRFFRLYHGLCGMTGTAVGSEREFKEFYDLPTVSIPLCKPSKRQTLATRYFTDDESKFAAIAQEVCARHQQGQPLLVGTSNIAASERLAELLASREIPFQVLNGRQDADEADIIAQAGQVGAVTIATNMAGRGTDIQPSADALARGGLHVIAAQRHASVRIDRQLAGRAARQGDVGSNQFFVSATDEFIQRHGRKLQSTFMRIGNGCTSRAIDKRVHSIQTHAEQLGLLTRRSLFQQDKQRDELMEKVAG